VVRLRSGHVTAALLAIRIVRRLTAAQAEMARCIDITVFE
jgi:hypothetical protein